MRYVLMNWVHPDDAAMWEASTAEEQQADVQRHIDWFRKHGEQIVGGEELDEPRTVKTLRPGRQGEGVVITDGPYVETKELLGGFVILESETLEDALAIASEWPSLSTQPRATVQLQPVFAREASPRYIADLTPRRPWRRHPADTAGHATPESRFVGR